MKYDVQESYDNILKGEIILEKTIVLSVAGIITWIR
jgi:hypothetical protein